MVVNGALGGADTPGSTGGTVVVVSDALSSCAGGTIVVVNVTVSSANAGYGGGTRVGANVVVSGDKTDSASVGEITVLMFALSLFGKVRDGESAVGTSNEGGFSGAVVVVALLVYRVFTVSGDFSVVVVVFVTWNAALLSSEASGVLRKIPLFLGGRTLVVRPFFFCAGS